MMDHLLPQGSLNEWIKPILPIFLLLSCLAATVSAGGAFNYNMTIDNLDQNVSIGSDFQVNGYIEYKGSPVREYPCIIKLIDSADNSTMFTDREYTDELGQLAYSRQIDDAFKYDLSYNYTVSCSNATAQGNLTITRSYPGHWLGNQLVFANSNMGVLVVGGVILMFVVLSAYVLLTVFVKHEE